MISISISAAAVWAVFIITGMTEADSAVLENEKEKKSLNQETYNNCNNPSENMSIVKFQDTYKDPDQRRKKHARDRESEYNQYCFQDEFHKLSVSTCFYYTLPRVIGIIYQGNKARKKAGARRGLLNNYDAGLLTIEELSIL